MRTETGPLLQQILQLLHVRRDLEHGRVYEEYSLRMTFPDHLSPALEVIQPIILTEIHPPSRTPLEEIPKVIRFEAPLRFDVPHSVLGPDTRTQLPSRIPPPTPFRRHAVLALVLVLGFQPSLPTLRINDDVPIPFRSQRTELPIIDHESLPHTQPHRLKSSGRRSDPQLDLLGVLSEILQTQVTLIGFVYRIPTDHALVQ